MSERMIEFCGTTKSIKQWAGELGLNVETLRKRLLRGMPVEEALTREKRYRRKRSNSWHTNTILQNKFPEGCCIPDCQNCPLPDCGYSGIPIREESKMIKAAMKPLPDTPGGLNHVYKIPGMWR